MIMVVIVIQEVRLVTKKAVIVTNVMKFEKPVMVSAVDEVRYAETNRTESVAPEVRHINVKLIYILNQITSQVLIKKITSLINWVRTLFLRNPLMSQLMNQWHSCGKK